MKSSSTVVWGVRLFTLCGCIILSVTSALGLRPQRMQVTASYHSDVSRPLREMAAMDIPHPATEREAAENPKIPNSHVDSPDPVIETGSVLHLFAPSIPAPILNFDGIPFPGVGCNCAPPDTNGDVGLTQYVQIVNEGYQVFDKTTGNSVLGPNSIVSLWSGFGGACETGGFGDPVVLYDQLADRWVISQFASATGGTPITDECVAVSTSGDATGTYNRYGFHLGSNFFDYPKLSVWPDAYYMSMNVFNSAGTAFLGPHRSPSIGHMLAGVRRDLHQPRAVRSALSSAHPAGRPRRLHLAARRRAEHLSSVPEQQSYRDLPLPCGLSPRRPTQPSPSSPPRRGGLYRALSHHALLRARVRRDSAEQLDGIGDR